MPLCVYVCVCMSASSLYISGFDTTKCWIVSNPVNAFLNIFRLRAIPGNAFTNMLPSYYLSGLWYSALGHPYVRILSFFYSASYCPHRAPPSPRMDAMLPFLASVFIHTTAYYLWISTSQDLDFYFAWLPASYAMSLLNVLLLESCSSLWMSLKHSFELTALDKS